MSRNSLIRFSLAGLWFSLDLCLLHRASGTSSLSSCSHPSYVLTEMSEEQTEQIRKITSQFHTFLGSFCACFNLDCFIDLIYSCISTTVLQGQEQASGNFFNWLCHWRKRTTGVLGHWGILLQLISSAERLQLISMGVELLWHSYTACKTRANPSAGCCSVPCKQQGRERKAGGTAHLHGPSGDLPGPSGDLSPLPRRRPGLSTSHQEQRVGGVRYKPLSLMILRLSLHSRRY